jgi:CDP-glucose 4,6-dehydratase
VSKSCTDLIAQTYHHTYKTPVAIARCGNIFGGGDLNWSRIVPGTIRSFLRGERPIIRSDGTYLRDYIYVKDVTRAYMRIAEAMDDSHIHGHGFNFSPERALSVLELVGMIQKIMGCEHIQPDIQNTAKGEIHSQYLDSAKARKMLGWQHQFSLDTGLADTVAWYRAFLGEALPEKV